MFQLEILELLKKIKNSSNEYELKKLKKSLCNLIKENPQKYTQFIQMQALDENTLSIFKECESIEIEENNFKSNEISDFDTIKKYYLKWLEIYLNNNSIPNEQNEQIIVELINFYIQNRFEVLEQILKINEDTNYDAFKNMLKNYIRKYFADKINSYYQSEEYKQLNLFTKRKKNKELLLLLEIVGKYEFNIKQISEVLK